MDFSRLGDFKKNNLRGDSVYKYLYETIVSGEYDLGEELSIREISLNLEVSNTPVREAMNMLENDGLVEKVPYKGYKIRDFTLEEIKDTFETRAAIESYAIKLTANNASNKETTKLKEIYNKSLDYLSKNDIENYTECNEIMHKSIIKFSGNLLLENIYKKVDGQINLFASHTVQIPGRPKKASNEHLKMINFICKGESNKARELMEKHIMSSYEDYKIYLQDNELP